MQSKAICFENVRGLVALKHWCRQVGFSDITAWRLRKKGWLNTVNICGRQYITQEAIAEFTARAENGEFSKQHRVPTPRRAV